MPKILVKLNEVANRLGLTITDIARDTGLNRNTVTALYHGKVDGIKFETLEKLMEAYNLTMDELIEVQGKVTKKLSGYVKDSRGMSLFAIWPWFFSNNSLPKEYFVRSLGNHIVYIKQDQGIFFNDYESYFGASKAIYEQYSDFKKFDHLTSIIHDSARLIRQEYDSMNQDKVDALNNNELTAYFKKVRTLCDNWAGLTTFLHGFDIDFERVETQKIANQYRLTVSEAATLTMPRHLIFTQERILKLLELVKRLKAKRLPTTELKKAIPTFIKTDLAVAQYLRDFNYYQTEFLSSRPISIEQLREEMEYYLDNPEIFKERYAKLSNYSKDHENKVGKILKKKKIKENPLEFFRRTTELREYRKQHNIMMITIIDYLLMALEKRTKIPAMYLRYMTFDDFENTLKGLIPLQTLKSRYEKGVFLDFEGDFFVMRTGEEATRELKKLEANVIDNSSEILMNGEVFVQGYGRGEVIFAENADQKNSVDKAVLVNQPVKDLRKFRNAAVIVFSGVPTNEEAEMLRDMLVPTMINAKQVVGYVSEGDLLEARCNHGTLRVLIKSKKNNKK